MVWQPDPRIPGLGTTHALFKRSFWGRATTRAALQEIYGGLVASGVRKIQTFPFKSNWAIIGLAKSLGARDEGTFREHTLRRQKWTDVAILAIFQEDFERCLTGSTSH